MLLGDLFLQVLNMSFTAGLTILAVLLARLALRRAPKALCCALWGVALFRLLCPFTFESAAALLPTNPQPVTREILYAAQPQVRTDIPALDGAVSAALPAAAPQNSVNPMQILVLAGEAIWLAGAATMALGGGISLLRLRRRLRGAEQQERGVFVVSGLPTAFVLGLVRPRIYLPDGLDEPEQRMILLHERTHVRRGDHVLRLLAWAALCIHWFNPLVWVAFGLSGRDVEMACDEAVIRALGPESKRGYAAALLRLATGRRMALGAPLAFGEGDAKGRIRNVLRYRRPALWIALAAVLAVAVLCFGLMANRPVYEAMVQVNGEVYRQEGPNRAHLPDGARELGELKSVLHRHDGPPERDNQGVNLDEKYTGAALYGSGDWVFVYDEAGVYLPFARVTGGADETLSVSAMRQALGKADAEIFFVRQESDADYVVGYTQGRDLGACALKRVGGTLTLEDDAAAPGLADGTPRAAVVRLSAFGGQYDVVLSTDERAASAPRCGCWPRPGTAMARRGSICMTRAARRWT